MARVYIFNLMFEEMIFILFELQMKTYVAFIKLGGTYL